MPVKNTKRNPRKSQAFWIAEEFAQPKNPDDLPYQGLILSFGLIIIMAIIAWMVSQGAHL